MDEYVFTWAGWEGPVVHRFTSAAALCGFIAGYTNGNTEVFAVSPLEWRA